MLIITILFYKEPEREIEGATLGEKLREIVVVLSDVKFAVFLFLTYYMQQTKGFSPIETGLAYLPMTAAIIAVFTIASGVFIR